MTTLNLKARRGTNTLTLTMDTDNKVSAIAGNLNGDDVADTRGSATFQENLVSLATGIAAEQISTKGGMARHLNRLGKGAIREFGSNGRHFTSLDLD